MYLVVLLYVLNCVVLCVFNCCCSSSSIGSATLVGFGLLNYRWVFSAGRFLQSAVASGTSKPQPGGPVIRTFQLSPQGVPSVWNDASEPQQRKVELWARNIREFCRKWRLLGSFTCRKFTTWDRRLYFPSQRRRAEDFFARKIRRLRPGLNPRTCVPKASTLTSRPPKLLIVLFYVLNCVFLCIFCCSICLCCSMYSIVLFYVLNCVVLCICVVICIVCVDCVVLCIVCV